MSDPTSDLAFRPAEPRRSAHRDDPAWEAVIREELAQLRRRTPSASRVVPVTRRPLRDAGPVGEPPAA